LSPKQERYSRVYMYLNVRHGYYSVDGIFFNDFFAPHIVLVSRLEYTDSLRCRAALKLSQIWSSPLVQAGSTPTYETRHVTQEKGWESRRKSPKHEKFWYQLGHHTSATNRYQNRDHGALTWDPVSLEMKVPRGTVNQILSYTAGTLEEWILDSRIFAHEWIQKTDQRVRWVSWKHPDTMVLTSSENGQVQW